MSVAPNLSAKTEAKSTCNAVQISFDRPMTSLALAAVYILYFAFAFWHLGYADLRPDEGRFANSATNVLHTRAGLARMGEDPEGIAATKPFGYALPLAFTIAIGGTGEAALRSVNVILLGLAGWFCFKFFLLRSRNSHLATATAAFFLLNPATIDYARLMTPEPLVVCSGCLAILACLKWVETHRVGWAILCGAALGYGFLAKMWLVGSFGLACVVLIVEDVRESKNPRILRPIALALGTFLLVASAHLIAVKILTPEDMGYWLKLYFGVAAANRIAGAAFDPNMWFRPWWFYLAAVYKAFFFVLPFLVLGTYSVIQRKDRKDLWFAGALLLPLLLFSFLRVKEAIYIFPIFAGLAYLVAEGWMSVLASISRKLGAGTALLCIIASIAMWSLHVLDARQALIAAIANGALIALTMLQTRDRRAYATAAMVLLLSIGVDVLCVRRSLDHRTYFREVGTYFRTAARPFAPSDTVFVAPEFPSMEFYLNRSGEYWHTFYKEKSEDELARELQSGGRLFYIVDPSGQLYGGKPSSSQIELLVNSAIDQTASIEAAIGYKLPYKIYEPKSQVNAAGR